MNAEDEAAVEQMAGVSLFSHEVRQIWRTELSCQPPEAQAITNLETAIPQGSAHPDILSSGIGTRMGLLSCQLHVTSGGLHKV